MNAKKMALDQIYKCLQKFFHEIKCKAKEYSASQVYFILSIYSNQMQQLLKEKGKSLSNQIWIKTRFNIENNH